MNPEHRPFVPYSGDDSRPYTLAPCRVLKAAGEWTPEGLKLPDGERLRYETPKPYVDAPKRREIAPTAPNVRRLRASEIAARKQRPLAPLREGKPTQPPRQQREKGQRGRPQLAFVLSKEAVLRYWGREFGPDQIAKDLRATRRVVVKRIDVFRKDPEFAARELEMRACDCGRTKYPYKRQCSRCTSSLGLLEHSNRKDITLELMIPMFQAGQTARQVGMHFGVDWHIINRRLRGGRHDPKFAEAIRQLSTCRTCGGHRQVQGLRSDCAKCIKAARRAERKAA